MLKSEKNKIIKEHDAIILSIQNALEKVQKDINKQIDIFYKDPQYKTYKGIRNDAGYKKWKNDVALRFNYTCCVCLSNEKIVFHHLFSYKYYAELRTDINNGVCLCEVCHHNFNELYSNRNTLQQFIEFRERFKNKPNKKFSFENILKYKTQEVTEEKRKPVAKQKTIAKKLQTPKEIENQKKIIDTFQDFKMKLWQESMELKKKYGLNKGIQIDFRNKKTTSLSAIKKLQFEVARLNTLISCNRMKDKTLMASKFHMPKEEFCKKLEDTKQYLNFTDSEITHLNMILRNDYKKEYNNLSVEINKKIHTGIKS